MIIQVGDLVRYSDRDKSEGFGIVAKFDAQRYSDCIIVKWLHVKGSPSKIQDWKTQWYSTDFGLHNDYEIKVLK